MNSVDETEVRFSGGVNELGPLTARQADALAGACGARAADEHLAAARAHGLEPRSATGLGAHVVRVAPARSSPDPGVTRRERVGDGRPAALAVPEGLVWHLVVAGLQAEVVDLGEEPVRVGAEGCVVLARAGRGAEVGDGWCVLCHECIVSAVCLRVSTAKCTNSAFFSAWAWADRECVRDGVPPPRTIPLRSLDLDDEPYRRVRGVRP